MLLAGGDRDPSVCLGGLSALIAWSLRNVDSDSVHVIVPVDCRRRTFAGAHPHRTKLTPFLDDARHLHPTATLPGRSLVDAVSWARNDQEARLVIAASCQQRLVVLPDVRRAAIEQPNAMRRSLLLATAVDCAGGFAQPR